MGTPTATIRAGTDPWSVPSAWSLEQDAPAASSTPRTERRQRLIQATREAMAAVPEDPWAPGGARRETTRTALQEMAHLRQWYYDPELPLAEVYGVPRWGKDDPDDATARVAPYGDETRAEFRQRVFDFLRELERGRELGPLLVEEVWPGADRAALGPAGYWLSTRLKPPAVQHDHYRLLRGRHRAVAAWLAGRRTMPARVWVAASEVSFPESITAVPGFARELHARMQIAVAMNDPVLR